MAVSDVNQGWEMGLRQGGVNVALFGQESYGGLSPLCDQESQYFSMVFVEIPHFPGLLANRVVVHAISIGSVGDAEWRWV